MSLLRLLKNMMGRTDDAFVMRYPIELAEPMATCFPGPVFVIDAQKNRILWASPGGLRLARLPASEAKNLTATEFLRRYFASERVMELYEARAERGEYSSPFRCEYGECYVVGVWYAIDSKTKQPPTRFMLVFMDATEMHVTHQNLLTQYAEELRHHTELTHRLMEEKDVLEAHQQELQAALLSARRLYNSFLSDIGLLRRVFSSVEVWLEPKEQIGGDFYFTDVDESAKRAFIVVGDSIGHGMASALLSIYFITELRKVNPELWGELPQLFNYLSGCLSSAFSLSSSNGSDIMISCEMAFLQADLSEQKLSFLGAKRPLWILRRGELYEISPSRIEISSAGAGNVSVHLLPLEKGDRLWVFSDGLTDQLNPQGKKFSPQRLREVLGQTAGTTLEEQVARVKEEVRLW
ncbi:MAG: SpoIIE family protein phosphatase, partial [Bacteroidia bacterium]|nr:SpoIIE family protein phosphatase [Bacteroidia bacterium]